MITFAEKSNPMTAKTIYNWGRLLASFCLLPCLGAQAQTTLNMIVGTYTHHNSEGMYSFSFNQLTGKATPLDTLRLSNPSFLTLNRAGNKIYAVSENSDSTAAVYDIDFNKATGKMTLRHTLPCYGADPCYIASNGRLLLTANYTGGSMSVFPLDAQGNVLPMSQQFKGHLAPQLLPQQSTPHIHCTQFTPDGQRVLATDFSANQLLAFKLDGTKLTPQGVVARLSSGSGCRHFVWSANKRFLYVVSELSGAVSVFRYGPGQMQRLQEIQSDSVGGHGSADIHLSCDGRYLYASNRLKSDGISIFRVNLNTGLLTKVGYQLTGIHPRNFAITPNGKYLLCACRDSNVIQVFAIDKETGLLTDTHQDIRMDSPVCIQFY